MTSITSPELYPQYCFHLSPTVGCWCPLRAADVVTLRTHPGFAGQQIFFHINHPIKWVRVAGVVIAVDEFNGRKIYTLDDSSGVTITCTVPPATPPPGGTNSAVGAVGNGDSSKPKSTTTSNTQKQPTIIDGDIEIGHIILVKGVIKTTFWREREIEAVKISHLLSTEQEVQFWEKVEKLRKETLNQPWVLDKRVVRRCQKEAEGHDVDRAKRHKKSASAAPQAAVAEVKPHNKVERSEKAISQPKARNSGLERRPKPPNPTIAASLVGKYSALGL
ncbi:hypothetical protein B0H67DRAFT_494868 [Lasiosphaeris hirsuta]|uniref:CST complex subunit Stn1 N-terminal domain-containing protein n=1 Tax=Lasiosphaeris hirsuta TaxID=260670 RepID=A0AA40A1F0_9PEZI|nr:hypothetical protein B0H67DRAFT_494868 [Lasiosphaeris hirsuta]